MCVFFRLALDGMFFFLFRVYAQLAHTQQQHQKHHQRQQRTGAHTAGRVHPSTDTALIRHIYCCCRYIYVSIYRYFITGKIFSDLSFFCVGDLIQASVNHRSRADPVDARCSDKASRYYDGRSSQRSTAQHSDSA